MRPGVGAIPPNNHPSVVSFFKQDTMQLKIFPTLCSGFIVRLCEKNPSEFPLIKAQIAAETYWQFLILNLENVVKCSKWLLQRLKPQNFPRRVYL